MLKPQNGFTPIQIILSILAGLVVLGGVVSGVLYFSGSKIQVGQGTCGDGVCGPAEKANPKLCPKDCGSSARENLKTISDLKYSSVNSEAVKLDLYFPDEKTCTGKLPLVIMIHGGAFKEGDKKPVRTEFLIKNCYAVASINYRLSGEAKFPAGNQDVKSAVRWLRANADKYNLDAEHFGAMGGSAGGYYSSFLGATGDVKDFDVGDNLEYSSAVQAVVDEYGLVNIATLAQDRVVSGLAPEPVESEYMGCDISLSTCANATKASPVSYISKGDAPFFILHGDKDDRIPIKQSKDFYALLKSKDIPANFTVVSGAGHGGAAFDRYESQIVEFFNKYLKSNQRSAATNEQQNQQTNGSQSAVPAFYSDNSNDADGFLWGTEVYPDKISTTKNIIYNDLKIKNLKARFQLNFFSKDGKNFSSTVCMPSANDCKQKYNMDDIVKTFKDNGWNMMPMFSHDNSKTSISNSDVDNYVNFVDWFIGKYGDSANIKYIELINSPASWWKGTTAQLLDLNNKTYDRIKGKYPEIKVGTPGFEYWIDDDPTGKGTQIVEYFLNKNNGAKFDFWAFHGYPVMDDIKLHNIYPPTKNPTLNKYGGIKGILEIRKIMDSNGWANRFIMDTEHTGSSLPKPTISDDEDKLDAAYLVQELTLKKALKNNDKFVLSGIMPLKIAAHGSTGEFLWASLKSDGSLSQAVKSVDFLLSKFNEYKYDSRINGEFDSENKVWVEKFSQITNTNRKELYLFFKPFAYKKGQSISFDNQTLNYTLHLSSMPKSITLTDISGNKKTISVSRDVILEANNSPQYLEVAY